MKRSNKNMAAVTMAATMACGAMARAGSVIGDWQTPSPFLIYNAGTMTNGTTGVNSSGLQGDGWFDWTASSGGTYPTGNPGLDPTDNLPTSIYNPSTTGATVGTYSLQMTAQSGYSQNLSIKMQYMTDAEGNEEMADFFNNTELTFDVAYNAADWEGNGAAGVYSRLYMDMNAPGFGFGALGTSYGIATNDTGNSGYLGGWDPSNFPGLTTRQITWNYSAYLPGGTATNTIAANAGYVEFITEAINGNNDTTFSGGNFYIGDVHLTNTQVTTQWYAQQHAPGTPYNWGTINNFQPYSQATGLGGMPCNPGDIVTFGYNNIPSGITETIDLNANADFQIAVGTMIFDDAGSSYVIDQGTGGTLTLNGNINNPTGTITAGTSAIADQGGNHTISAPVALATNTTIAVGVSTNTFTISGAISGAGGLTFTGLASPACAMVGTAVLSGNNSYAGATTINSGTVQVGHTNALGFGGAITATSYASFPSATVNTGGTLDLNGTNLNHPIVLSGGTLTNSNVSSTAGLSSAVNGYVVTSGGSGLPGNPTTSVAGGGGSLASFQLLLGLTNASLTLTSPGGGYGSAPTVQITGGGGTGATATVTMSGVSPNETVQSITITNPGVGYTSAPTVNLIFGGGTTTPATVVANASNFTAVGAQALTAGSGYTSYPTASSSSGTVSPTIGAVLNTLSVYSSSTINGAGQFALNTAVNGVNSSGTATLTLDGTNAANSIGGVISDGGGGGHLALTKSNTSTWSLSAANTFTGPTTIVGGTVSLTGSGSVSSSSSINVNGGTLDVTGTSGTYAIGSAQTLLGQDPISGHAVNGALNVNGILSLGQVAHSSAATMTIAGAVTLGSTATSNFDLFNTTGSADLLKIGATGTGALTANGALDVAEGNGFSGTFAAGEAWDLLSFGSEAGTFSSITLPTLSPSLLWNTSQLYTNGTISIINNGPPNLSWDNAGGSSPDDGQTWDISHSNNWNNSTAATMYTDGALVTLNDTNNGNYAVTLSTTVSPGSVTVNNSSGNYTISGSGSIAGTTSLTKLGIGTLAISTANTYSGGTFVNAGTLLINPTASPGTNSALPSGRSVSIATGAALKLAPYVSSASP
ncbi:MAG: autotransporter-associated beta strand repeat-containing protein, partial [Tepidisphaeraceae bacterium]